MAESKVAEPTTKNHQDQQVVYCTEYKHAKTGKIMVPAEYGLKAWRFLVRTNGK